MFNPRNDSTLTLSLTTSSFDISGDSSLDMTNLDQSDTTIDFDVVSYIENILREDDDYEIDWNDTKIIFSSN